MTSVCHAQPQFEHRWYVDASAVPGGGGSEGWQDAFTDLQQALAAAQATIEESDEIWVAAGTYYPCDPAVDPNCHTVSFNLVEDTALYGGFLGSESERFQRDPLLNETILSGDIDQDGDPGTEVGDPDNSWHVVRAEGVDSTAVLDGFVITGGYADGDGVEDHGGGILIRDGSPRVIRCKLIRNVASLPAGSGGGIYVRFETTAATSPVIVNCSFLENSSSLVGGAGMRVHEDSNGDAQAPIQVLNCVFAKAPRNGGAIHVDGPDLDLRNCTFNFNDHFCPPVPAQRAQVTVVSGSQVTMTNSVMWDGMGLTNFAVDCDSGSSVTVSYSFVLHGLDFVAFPNCDLDFGCVMDGGNNIYEGDPLFRDVANEDYRLQDSSPCIDAGSAYENQHIRSCRWDIANASGGPPPDGQVGNADRQLGILSAGARGSGRLRATRQRRGWIV